MSGITFYDKFKPEGCSYFIDTPAVTTAAGSQMEEINLATSLRNLTVMSAGGPTVGIGGYLTGGGHSVLSATYGLAADQVLEVEIVTPGGDILTVTECQNRDLFWAVRGVSLCPRQGKS
jgi:FAD/FMN-containing dehydrogenase